MKFTSRNFYCPKCGDIANLVHRRVSDCFVNLFKPVERYKCYSCKWENSIPAEIARRAAQERLKQKAQFHISEDKNNIKSSFGAMNRH